MIILVKDRRASQEYYPVGLGLKISFSTVKNNIMWGEDVYMENCSF